MKYLFFASNHGLPKTLYVDYRDAGYKIILVSLNTNVSGLFDYFVRFNSRVIPYSYLENLPFLSDCEQIIVRNYIEPGSHRISGLPSHVYHFCILGDTHHMKGALLDAFDFISQNPVTILTSYANPFDCLLLSRFFPNIRSVKAYPLELHSTFWSNNHLSDLPNARDPAILLCASLNRFQKPRSRLVRQILMNKKLCLLFELLPFQGNPNCYMKSLQSYMYSFVPLNGGQISPQISCAISCGNIPISTSVEQMTLHSCYSFFRQYTLHLELKSLSFLNLQSLIQKHSYMSLQLHEERRAFYHKNKSFLSELDFLHDEAYDLDSSHIRIDSLDNLPRQYIYNLFSLIDSTLTASCDCTLSPDRLNLLAHKKSTLPQSILSIYKLFVFYHDLPAL